MYLKWDEKTITDFSDKNINSLYNEGYVFTRLGKGVMQKTRSVRIDLDKFELTSENKRVLKKVEGLDLQIENLPYKKYDWSVGKLAKNFYDTKFGQGIFSANKIKELLTEPDKSNFNSLFVYQSPDNSMAGYAICYANSTIVHYSYPFYKPQTSTTCLQATSYKLQANSGMGMMIMAIVAAQKNNKKYVYLGSAQRPTDTYKLQFNELEWFNDKKWSNDIDELKQIIKKTCDE